MAPTGATPACPGPSVIQGSLSSPRPPGHRADAHRQRPTYQLPARAGNVSPLPPSEAAALCDAGPFCASVSMTMRITTASASLSSCESLMSEEMGYPRPCWHRAGCLSVSLGSHPAFRGLRVCQQEDFLFNIYLSIWLYQALAAVCGI